MKHKNKEEKSIFEYIKRPRATIISLLLILTFSSINYGQENLDLKKFWEFKNYTIYGGKSYEYGLGKHIGITLSYGCSVNKAVVKDWKNKRLYFEILKNYRLQKGLKEMKKRVSVYYEFSQPLSKIPIDKVHVSQDEFWRRGGNMKIGAEVMLFLCEETAIGFRETDSFITTDSRYFEEIIKVVKLFAEFQENPYSLINFYSGSPKPKSDIAEGMAYNCLYFGGCSGDIGAYVITHFLQDGENSRNLVLRDKIGYILSSFHKPSMPELREKTFRKLIEFATEDERLSEDATRVLPYIARSNPSELRRYINSLQAKKILVTLNSLNSQTITEGDKKVLEDFLLTFD